MNFPAASSRPAPRVLAGGIGGNASCFGDKYYSTERRPIESCYGSYYSICFRIDGNNADEIIRLTARSLPPRLQPPLAAPSTVNPRRYAIHIRLTRLFIFSRNPKSNIPFERPRLLAPVNKRPRDLGLSKRCDRLIFPFFPPCTAPRFSANRRPVLIGSLLLRV